ncbi:hypothetical protein ACSBR1_036070 [Camellia fascicularis]
MSSAISQLSSFSSISRRLHLHTRPCPNFRSKVLVVMNSDGSGTGISGSQTKTNLSYTADASRSHIEGSAKSYATTSENDNGKGMNEPVQGHAVTQQIRAAKIHDFCLGIPFGGLFLSEGLVGFIFTRNPTTLRTDALFGAALLSLSILSLKTKKLFPTGFYAAISCQLALGEVEDALQYFSKCVESGSHVCLDRRIIIEAANGLQNAQKVAERVNQCAELLRQRTSNAAISALEIISQVLSISSYSEKLLDMKGEALLMLRRYEEVIQLCEQTLVFAEKNFAVVTGDNNIVNVDGLEYKNSSIRLWRWLLISKSYFYLGRLDEALDLLEKQELSRSTEDRHGSSTRESSIPFAVTVRELLHRKNAGNEAFQSGRHTEAVEHYTAVVSSSIESRPFAAICFCNRAAAHQSLGQIADAIADCSLAIALDGSYSKAVSRRATLHETIRDYEQAASDLHRLISLLEKQSQEKVQQCGSPDGSAGGNVKELRQARRRLSSVEEKAKKGISLDHYLILGIKPSDAASEIKKAYRKAALRHHPDKAGQFLARSESGDAGQLWKQIADEVHKDADRLFKMIGEAYAMLSDPTKRSHYDVQEELRNAQKESNESRASRGPSDYYSSPFDGSASRRYWKQSWKTYGNSHSQF